MKKLEDVRKEIAALCDRMRKGLGPHIDQPAEIVRSCLSAKIASKSVEMVDAVFGTYSLPELVMAAEVAAEAEAMEDCLAGEARN